MFNVVWLPFPRMVEYELSGLLFRGWSRRMMTDEAYSLKFHDQFRPTLRCITWEDFSLFEHMEML